MKKIDNILLQKHPCLCWGVMFLSLGLLFFGIKLSIIEKFGNATPFWDQWDAEAANLYKPFFEGTLSFGQLLEAHNEHRILTTRLLSLLLLKINGLWNPLLQMIVNAALHLAVIFLLIAIMAYGVGKKALIHLSLFALILFSIPYGWENTIAGFQSQFYFVLLFSLLTIFLITQKALFSFLWGIGVLFGVLAFFSFASGLFALFACAITFGVQYAFGVDHSVKRLLAGLFLGGIFLIGLFFTPYVAPHDSLKAHSLMQFSKSLIQEVSWPLPGNLFSLLVCNFPLLIFCGYLLIIKPSVKDRRWLLFALVVWTCAQSASLAYGRAECCLSSRYCDLFAVSLFVNFGCLLYLVRGKVTQIIPYIWAGVILIVLIANFHKKISQDLGYRRDVAIDQAINVKNYLITGDIHHLQGKPLLHIPYPDPNRLADVLSSPIIQNILPANIHKPLEGGAAVKGRCDGGVAFLLSNYIGVIAMGIFMMLLLAWNFAKIVKKHFSGKHELHRQLK